MVGLFWLSCVKAKRKINKKLMRHIAVMTSAGVFLGRIFAAMSQVANTIIRIYGISQRIVLSVQYIVLKTEQEPSCLIPKQTSLWLEKPLTIAMLHAYVQPMRVINVR